MAPDPRMAVGIPRLQVLRHSEPSDRVPPGRGPATSAVLLPRPALSFFPGFWSFFSPRPPVPLLGPCLGLSGTGRRRLLLVGARVGLGSRLGCGCAFGCCAAASPAPAAAWPDPCFFACCCCACSCFGPAAAWPDPAALPAAAATAPASLLLLGLALLLLPAAAAPAPVRLLLLGLACCFACCCCACSCFA